MVIIVMEYKEYINSLIKKIDSGLVDFDEPRVKARKPTQTSSEFLTNKQQGDWAENTLLKAINENVSEYIAVRYGKNDDINAGETGFDELYKNYQAELDEIGKRPDLLIFRREDFGYDTIDISNYPNEELDKIVPKAKCGLEVRSSSFLIDKYEQFIENRNTDLINNIKRLKNTIINEYGELLKSKDEDLYKVIDSISASNMYVISFNSKSWRSTSELITLSGLIKELKKLLNTISRSKRDFLSITPKVEDLKVVNTWVQKYNVPHYYVQVFFDKAYGISFEKILKLLGSPELEGVDYFIESDTKNQGKTTIKINALNEANILEKINIPEHYSQVRELNRGRLLFYVRFKDSISNFNKDEFEKLVGFKLT